MRFPALLAGLVLAIASMPTASLAKDTPTNGGWWTHAPRVFAVEQVGSYRRILEPSGDEADIYHPIPSHKERGLYTNRFPIVVLLQGALVDKEYYSSFGMHLARYGFVVVIANHERALFGESGLYSEVSVMTEALAQMRLDVLNPESPVYGLVDTETLALSGHSFGGAAALYTINDLCGFPFCNPASGFVRPPELKAAALVSTNAGAVNIDSNGLPVAITIGDQERSVADAELTYANLEPPKALIKIHGANHFGVNDIGQPPGANFDRGEPLQVLPQAMSAYRFARWSGLFLRAHLYMDWNAYVQVYRNREDGNVTIWSQLQ